jgi:signal transduction histidine kinase
MKRALKIFSRKTNIVGIKPVRLKSTLVSTNALSEQGTAHIEKKQLTLNVVNELVLTLSHYLNSPLTVLLGKVEILSEATENGGMSKGEIKEFAESCKREIHKIESIMKTFQNLCEVRYKTYPPGIKMLDVEKEIKDGLKRVEAFDLDIITAQRR